MRPTTHASTNPLRGRALTALGRVAKVEVAFEEAIGVASKHGLCLLEMLMLVGVGRGSRGAAEGGAAQDVMRPALEIMKLFGGGLDAGEIMRLWSMTGALARVCVASWHTTE